MKKLLFILGLTLVACESPEEQVASIRRDDVYYLSTSVKYYKDVRTKMCFAGTSFGGYSQILATVPCTPEVENNIIMFISKQ